ncbi:WxL protein peptidoglycan domain-containing protein [Aquihabitans daechungensis]|uniref:WxL protein peptidoglycan domain-containing protein n=1 Tax=Aquihabitans daechungensis TaxID=1052257 RepID=UPI003BA09D06
MSTRRHARSRWHGGLIALLILLIAVLTPAPGAAQEGTEAPEAPEAAPPAPGPWSFTPTSPQQGPGRNWFILDMQPGQTLRDSVAIANTTTEPLSFAIYTANAYNAENGGAFAIRSATEEKEGVATWVSLATDAYTVQPGRKVVVPFEISVPEDAGSGDHVAAIAAMDINPEGTTESGGVKLDIKRIVGVRLYIRVAGPMSPELDVDQLSVTTDAPRFGVGGDPSGTIRYRVTNTGNTTLAPKATATISGGLGGPDVELDATAVRELLPGNSVIVEDTWEGLPVAGPLTARVEATAPADDVRATAEVTEWIVPWPLIVALVLLLIVAVGLLARRRKRRRAQAPPSAAAPATAREPETVSS